MQSIPINLTKIIYALGVLLILINQQNTYALESDSLKSAEKIIVDSIKIIGNNKTKDFIILRELNFQVGDTINESKLHYNRERIFSLGLFNRVELSVKRAESKSIIFIDVEETWYIYPIPFWYIERSSLSNSTVGVNLSWKNFRGRNETLLSSFGIGFNTFLSFQYDNPALFYNSNIGFTFGFGYYRMSNINDEAKLIAHSNFNYRIIKGNISFYKRLNQYNLFGASFGFDNLQLDIPPVSKLTASGTSVDNYPWISAYYYFDSRDLKQFSKNGFLLFGGIAYKGFDVKGVSYNIADIDLREYQNIVGDLSAKWRIKYRQAFGKLIPFYDYSFLGYSDRVRGHSSDYVEGENSVLTSLEFSYSLLKEWNVSLDLPLIPKSLTSARIEMYLHAFADAGTAFNKGEPLYLNRFYSGYGFGLTVLILPFNAVRFEYALNELGNGEFILATGFSF